jgi:cysteinyl-tRNA synthetase
VFAGATMSPDLPTFRFYDTLSKKPVDYTPPADRPVTMYNCGPTVYSYAHIGNFRSFLFADTLRRALEYHGVAVRQIMNITDVGHLTDDTLEQGLDKLEAAAKKESLTPWDIAARFTEAFQEDRKTLGILDAERYPRASDFVPQMQEMISKMLADGIAYAADDGEVYFDVKKFPAYGRLSGNTLDNLKEHVRGAIQERGNKRDQRDFALWKQEEGHLMQWPAPWAPKGSGDNGGFPGWHIECSAMSRAYLGDTLDFHTGGEDNIFPHHEAEIAQSESFTGKRFVNIWMHARHLLVHEQKMAKSTGNFFTVRDVLRGRDASGVLMAHPATHPAALRLALIKDHYRQHMNYVPDQVPQNEAFARRIAEATDIAGSPGFAALPPIAERHPEEATFAAALRDDLNM